MDDKWFTYVRERLAQIERENATRYGGGDDDDDETRNSLIKTLWCHPSIVNSGYWHHSDARATSACFDWDNQRFPDGYVAALRQATPAMVHRVAGLPYRHIVITSDIEMENQRILVARLLMLNQGHLLIQ